MTGRLLSLVRVFVGRSLQKVQGHRTMPGHRAEVGSLAPSPKGTAHTRRLRGGDGGNHPRSQNSATAMPPQLIGRSPP